MAQMDTSSVCHILALFVRLKVTEFVFFDFSKFFHSKYNLHHLVSLATSLLAFSAYFVEFMQDLYVFGQFWLH